MSIQVSIEDELQVPLTGTVPKPTSNVRKYVFGALAALSLVCIGGLIISSGGGDETKAVINESDNVGRLVSSDVTVHIIRHAEKPDDNSPDLK